jgi:uncharacterized protein (TIGR02246 family)
MPRARLALALTVCPIAFAPLASRLYAQAPGHGAAPAAAAPPALAATLMRLQRDYFQGAVTRDSAAATRLVSPDAVVINPDGSTETGTQEVQDVLTGRAVFESIRADSMQVRQLSPTVAVVIGRATLRGRMTPPGGGAAQDISGAYRFLNIWRQQGGRWQVVADHTTRIGAP